MNVFQCQFDTNRPCPQRRKLPSMQDFIRVNYLHIKLHADAFRKSELDSDSFIQQTESPDNAIYVEDKTCRTLI